MEAGLRVVRGPDWKYGDQDGGEGRVGTVVDIGGQSGSATPEKWVAVIWDHGVREAYRAGRGNAYDLHAFDNGQCGVTHPSTQCVGCQESGIGGFRWKCVVCDDVDLCTSCYMSDKHDTSHSFIRHDTSSSDGVRLPARNTCKNEKRSAMGIFTDAVVSRGKDWKWDNQDGGDGQTGRVVKIANWKQFFRGLITVAWNSGTKNNYRLGAEGKVDLKSVVPTSGGNYYKTHLPVVGKMKEETPGQDFAENLLPSLYGAALGTMLLRPLLDMLGEGLSELMTLESPDYGVGFRVVRGPDWQGENQDDGEGFLGTVVEIGGPGQTQPRINFVKVVWDNGSENFYRTGHEEKFDLRVYDFGAGTKHESVMCDVCKAKAIPGIRWNCVECKTVNLCSECYSNDEHDVNHQFLRYDSPEPKKIFKVPKRSESQKVQTMGIFPGASVRRGRDWRWGDQDGGAGNVGRVLSIEDTVRSSYRSSVPVQWPSGSKNSYRLGENGKVDLKCTKATPGGFYYRKHMPILGKEKPPEKTGRFKAGDKVRCSVQAPNLMNLQHGHGGFAEDMIPLINIPGSVKSIDEDGDVVVLFPNGRQFTYNPDALTKE